MNSNRPKFPFSATSFATYGGKEYGSKEYVTDTATAITEQLILPSSAPTVKTLTQKKILSKYNATKSTIHWHLVNIFHLSPAYVACCSNYFLLHYTGKKFSQRLVDGTITVTDEVGSKKYAVIYEDCTPVVAKKAHLLHVSFRSAKDEIGIPYNYAVIRVTEESRLES